MNGKKRSRINFPFLFFFVSRRDKFVLLTIIKIIISAENEKKDFEKLYKWTSLLFIILVTNSV